MKSGDIWQKAPEVGRGDGGGADEPQRGALTKAGNHAVVIDKVGGAGSGFESHQLSGFSCVSMSTRQIGHFRLVASHWSTQPWWKRCMQGNLLEEGKRDEEEEEEDKTRSALNAMNHIDKHESADKLHGNVPM